MRDATDQWLTPMFQAMTTHTGRSLGNLIEATVRDGLLDWVALGRAMRDELDWPNYPAYPPQTPQTIG
jgi:hypothetical protein